MAAKLTDFQVLAFDVYGTLADWETGFFAALQPLLARFSPSWDRATAISVFNTIEHQLEQEQPHLLYSDLLREVHVRMEQKLSAESVERDTSTPPAENRHELFASSIRQFQGFPDSSEALHLLSKYYKLVVLSNVDRASFAYIHAKLSEGNDANPDLALYRCPEPNPHRFWFPKTIPGSKSPFTMIITAQDVGAYKPAKKGFLTVVETIQNDPAFLNSPGGSDAKEKLLWVAQSRQHDIEPTRELGIRNVWLDRKNAFIGMEYDGQEPKWTWRYQTLAELAAAVQKEFGDN